MQCAATGGVSRRWLVPLRGSVLFIAMCVLISGGVWAQNGQKEKRESGKSDTKREARENRESSGSRDTSAKQSAGSRLTEKVKGSAGERKGGGEKSSGDASRAWKDSGVSGSSGRAGDSRRDTGSRTVERDRSDTSTRERLETRADDRTSRERKTSIYDRYRRTRRTDDGNRDEEKRKNKKVNPGYRKKIIKPGENKRIRIDPRPGRYDPPPPPHVDIDIDIWDPWVPPMPPYPWVPPLIGDYYPDRDYVIHLPAGVIVPEGVESAFLEKIEYLRSIDRGDSFLVCLYQTRDPITSEEVNYLFERGVTFYRFLTSCTSIIDATVDDIVLLVMDQPNFRWIGEYQAEYKYSHEPRLSNRQGAYVHSLAGDSFEFRNALKHLGIKVITYYEDTEDFYVIADWEQFYEIARCWWVEKVYKEPETFSEITFDE